MMNIKFYMCDTHACGHFRGELPAREINTQTRHRMDCKTTILMSDYPGTDLMVFQRQTRTLDQVRHARKCGIATIYEIDDDIWNIPEVFASYGKQVLRPVESEEIMRAVDAITVSTPELGTEVMGRMVGGPPVFVVENALDIETWSALCAAREAAKTEQTETVTIGWMASQSHLMDAPLVGEVLRDLMAKYPQVRLHFIGWIGIGAFYGDLLKPFADRIRVDDWLPISQLPAAMVDWDIGLLPLVDHPWNRSKSELKWMQYAALGIPAVASPMPCYLRACKKNAGLIATHNAPAGWFVMLNTLILSADYRRQIGSAMRRELYMRYDMRARVHEWVDVFEKVTLLRP